MKKILCFLGLHSYKEKEEQPNDSVSKHYLQTYYKCECCPKEVCL